MKFSEIKYDIRSCILIITYCAHADIVVYDYCNRFHTVVVDTPPTVVIFILEILSENIYSTLCACARVSVSIVYRPVENYGLCSVQRMSSLRAVHGRERNYDSLRARQLHRYVIIISYTYPSLYRGILF